MSSRRPAPPASPARCGSTRSASTSTSCDADEAALRRIAPDIAALADAEGLHRARPRRWRSGSRRRCRSAPRDAAAPRPDLGTLEGYHSPQLDVAVRLNTNESPYPPPAGVRRRVARRAPRDPAEPLPRPCRPARSARALADAAGPADRPGCSAPTGRTRCSRRCCLAYGGPGRRRARVRADVRAARPHRPASPARTSSRAPAARTSPCRRPRPTMLIASERPAVVFLCSPNNPTGTVEPQATVEALLGAVGEHGPGLLVVDEAYGEFAGWSAQALVGDDVPLVVARTYSKVWSMAALRLGFAVAPARGRRAARRGRAAVPPRGADPAGRGRGAHLRRRDAGPRRRAGRRAPPACRRAAAPARPHRLPVGRELRAGARRQRRSRPLAAPRRPRGARPRLLARCRASRTACGSPSGRRPRTTSSSPRSASRWRRRHDRTPQRRAAPQPPTRPGST